MDRWRKIHETGDYGLLLKKGKAKSTTLEALWDKIQNEFLNRYGLTKIFLDYIHLQFQIIELNCEFLQTGDRELQQKIQILDHRIKDIEEKFEDGMDFEEMYAWVSIETKLNLPMHTTSVEQYQAILGQAVKMAKIKADKMNELKAKRGKKVYG